jgi:hypothetical protein
MRTSTKNLAIGFQTVRWHDTVHQVKTLFPDAFEHGEDVIVPRFTRFDPDVSLCARLIFSAGELDTIELYPSIEHDVSDWSSRKRQLVDRFETLAESNHSADVSIEEDWSDVQVRIRRRPLGQ